jgi:hypothetical protein
LQVRAAARFVDPNAARKIASWGAHQLVTPAYLGRSATTAGPALAFAERGFEKPYAFLREVDPLVAELVTKGLLTRLHDGSVAIEGLHTRDRKGRRAFPRIDFVGPGIAALERI